MGNQAIPHCTAYVGLPSAWDSVEGDHIFPRFEEDLLNWGH